MAPLGFLTLGLHVDLEHLASEEYVGKYEMVVLLDLQPLQKTTVRDNPQSAAHNHKITLDRADWYEIKLFMIY